MPEGKESAAPPLQRLRNDLLAAELADAQSAEVAALDSTASDGLEDAARNDVANEPGGAATELRNTLRTVRHVRRRRRSPERDPALLCATLLLREVIRKSVSDGKPLRDAQIVVLEAPTAWIEPVVTAWRRLVAGDNAPTRIEDRDAKAGKWPNRTRPDWLLFARVGTERSHTPDTGNDVVGLAAMEGVPTLGISPDPARLLPRALVQTADLRLTLPMPNVQVLLRISRMITGRSPLEGIAADLCRGVSPELLRLARRRGQTADAWLQRLADLVRAQAAPVHGITLAELAGMDEVVAWGEGLAGDIADCRAGRISWAAIDRGALMAGPPGVGKTTAAKAIAGSCQLPLIATGYAAWQAHREGHLGNVIQAIREVFERARALSPCLLFIDEIDSVRRRGSDSRSDDWWTAIVNCLLEQLDGLAGREGVVVIAATNYPDMVDPAIRRAGRLDRVISIPLPSEEALIGILRFHLAGELASAALGPLAERLEAQGGTGADVEKLVRGARRRARQAGRGLIIEDLRAELGASKVAASPELRWRHAVHEAGHAMAASAESSGSVVRISVRERGTVGGWTAMQRDRDALTRERVELALRTLLAGRAAEQVILGTVSAGAGGDPASDLAQATWLATSVVMSAGFGQRRTHLLWRAMPDPAVGLPLALPSDVEAEIADLLAEAYAAAVALIGAHRYAVAALAERLLEVGEMDGPAAEALLRRHSPGEAATEINPSPTGQAQCFNPDRLT